MQERDGYCLGRQQIHKSVFQPQHRHKVTVTAQVAIKHESQAEPVCRNHQHFTGDRFPPKSDPDLVSGIEGQRALAPAYPSPLARLKRAPPKHYLT